uniref:Uncharacterized protein n=1 Tax=Avena sativa TaxID=4498 RepID=A0ACD5TYS0_AVESA
MPDLPCDGDGVCMVCRAASPAEVELLRCATCATPWHSPCLSRPPALADAATWSCPDCSGDSSSSSPPTAAPAPSLAGGDMLAAIRRIEADATLSDHDKARARQELLGGAAAHKAAAGGDSDGDEEENALDELVAQNFTCSFCMKLPDRPVTTPCGHNFCLKCFEKWIHSGKRTCGKCRGPIPSKMAEQPRINAALVAAIRFARTSKNAKSAASANAYHYIRNDDRPESAFTTDRAKRAGKANASSGQIFVTIPPDHFGPILAKNDPKRNTGVLVGQTWGDRLECRQWGAHFPHVAGIAGQSTHGAQSVALSGGYIDDEDHGEWFLYTGSGGRDLSGNKRTNKDQSSDQKFENSNAALRVSCLKGYPVRVVRSHKEKRSSYAPEKGVRYDGVYRIEKCWRKIGVQGTYKVCRYLFVRCDNEPAPWTSDLHGDRPRPLPKIKELQGATDITERKGSASWDYDEKEGWKWVKDPPASKKPVQTGNPVSDKEIRKYQRQNRMSKAERLLKEFGCSICRDVIKEPLTTPCAHNFCKACLLGSFEDKASMRERSRGGRTLRAQKIVKKCPSCPTDLCDFLENPQINREMMNLIETFRSQAAEEKKDVEESGEDNEDAAEKEEDDDSSLNEEENDDVAAENKENDGAENKKTEDLDGEQDAGLKKVVKFVVESKEEVVKKAQKRKGDDGEEGKDEKKIKTTAAADNAAEGDAVKQQEMEKGTENAEDNKEEGAQKVQRKRKGCVVAAGGGKRKKAGSAEADGSAAAASTPRKTTRISGLADGGGSPASRTRSSATKAGGGGN